MLLLGNTKKRAREMKALVTLGSNIKEPERNPSNKIEKVFPILIQDGDAKVGTKINIHV